MPLSDMLDTLRLAQRVEVRDHEGYELFTCMSDSAALRPYLDCKVIEWFAGAAPTKVCDFTVFIEDE